MTAQIDPLRKPVGVAPESLYEEAGIPFSLLLYPELSSITHHDHFLFPVSRLQRQLTGGFSREYRAHKGKVHTLAWSPVDGRRLASGSTDTMIRIWWPERSNLSKDTIELRGHTASVDQVAFDPTNADIVASASADKTLRLWDVRSGQCIAKMATPGENINLCWRPDGKQIVVGSKDDVVAVFDIQQQKLDRKHSFQFEVNEMRYASSHDKLMLTTGLGTLQIVEMETWETLETIQAHTANAQCVDRNGTHLVTGGADAAVQVWSMKDFHCLKTLQAGHEGPIRTLALSFNGEIVASASEEKSISLTHLESGLLLHRIQCNANMHALAWHPSKLHLAYAGDDADRYGRSDGILRVFVASSGL